MRGGVISKVSSEPLDVQIDRILRDSTFTFISCGSYGFVFKVTFNGKDSGFINPETGEEVREFVIKVQSIDMKMSHEKCELISDKIDWEKLTTEVEMQQKLYKTSLEKFKYPVCPAILYYEGITVEQLETYITDQFIYRSHERIPKEDYPTYHVAIILMEFVPSSDLDVVVSALPKGNRTDDLNYWRRLQDLKNKAFTIYCMALLCGINQNDVFGRNFLLDKNDRVTMIDFGIAGELDPETVTTIEGLVDDCRKGVSKALTKLIDYLILLDDHEEHLKIWLFKKGWPKQPYDLELLDFPNHLPDNIVEKCKTGICQPTNTQPIGQKRKDRYDYEIEDRIKRAEVELKEKPRESFWGGKRRTKYVGTRRHKRLGTRRKV